MIDKSEDGCKICAGSEADVAIESFAKSNDTVMRREEWSLRDQGSPVGFASKLVTISRYSLRLVRHTLFGAGEQRRGESSNGNADGPLPAATRFTRTDSDISTT